MANCKETAFGIRFSKWKLSVLAGLMFVIFGGFTYLLAEDAKQDEICKEKATIDQLIEVAAENKDEHKRLTDNQRIIYDKIDENQKINLEKIGKTQKALGRIEGYLERMAEE